jgi:hypothetical protein
MDGDMPTGIAPDAALYASAYVTGGITPGYQHALVATQHISTQSGVFVVNHSWAKPRATGTELNGNSLLTLGFDWSARVHDVLHVVAGNQDGETNSVPTDNFNGITVAASDKIGDVYRRVWDDNRYDDDANGDERTSIGIIAPGVDVELTGLGNIHSRDSGTSLAAPHVSGTVALLHQYGEERIMNVGAPRWNDTALRHQVMKAVLLNSADKLIDDGTVMVNGMAVPMGALLGMERTVVKQDGMSTWLESLAYDDTSLEGFGRGIPLDIEMGAGHLNARRAVQQFSPGEYPAESGDVPPIGWDFGNTTGINDIERYPLAGSLTANHFISITLAWDRVVNFETDAAPVGVYNVGDTFQESTATSPQPDSDDLINDLDIFLLPKGSFNINQAVAESTSVEGTLEHLFFQIPSTDEYEIWVRQFDADISGGQTYGLAWWYGVAPPLVVQGDYNGDSIVNIQDFNFWKANFGNMVTPGTGADGNGNGIVDAADYVIWRKNLAAGSGGSTSIPEPTGALLTVAVILLLLRQRTNLWSRVR